MRDDLMIPKSVKFDKAKITVSQEMKEDHYDLVGELQKTMLKRAAALMDQKVMAEIDGILRSHNPDGSKAMPDINKPLTQESFDKALQSVKVTERYGAGYINGNGIAVAKDIGLSKGWPSITEATTLIDVMIMREFAELGSPFSEDDLRSVAEESIGKVFDVDWLISKYPQGNIAGFAGLGEKYIVHTAEVKPYKNERAVFTTGGLVNKNGNSFTGVQGTGIRGTRSKNGMAGNMVMQKLMGKHADPIILDAVDLSEQLPDAIGTVESYDFDPTTGNMNVNVKMHQPLDKVFVNIDLK